MLACADGRARGRPRALLLALERGVLSSALECTARGHDQVHPENPPDKWLTLPIMVLENSKLVKMTVPHIAPWLPMRLSGNTLLLKLFPKN